MDPSRGADDFVGSCLYPDKIPRILSESAKRYNHLTKTGGAKRSDLAMFPLSEEHKLIRDAARDFAQKEIIPIAAEFDERGEFPHVTVKKMGEMGFMGIEVPEQYGGAGMDTLAYVLALEVICTADAAHGVVMSVNHSLYCHGILKYGREEQKTVIGGYDRADTRLNHRMQPP